MNSKETLYGKSLVWYSRNEEAEVDFAKFSLLHSMNRGEKASITKLLSTYQAFKAILYTHSYIVSTENIMKMSQGATYFAIKMKSQMER